MRKKLIKKNKKRTSKLEQKTIERVAWGRDIKLKENKPKKKKGEFVKNLNENLTKLKLGADKLSDGLFGENQIDLMGSENNILFPKDKKKSKDDFLGLGSINFVI